MKSVVLVTLALLAPATLAAQAAPRPNPAPEGRRVAAPDDMLVVEELESASALHAPAKIKHAVAIKENFLIFATASDVDDFTTTARMFERVGGAWRQVGGAFRLGFEGEPLKPIITGWLHAHISAWSGMKHRVYVLTTDQYRQHLARPIEGLPVPEDLVHWRPAQSLVAVGARVDAIGHKLPHATPAQVGFGKAVVKAGKPSTVAKRIAAKIKAMPARVRAATPSAKAKAGK